MNIEIGNYVRTFDGIIGKLVNIDNGEYHIKIDEDNIWKCFKDSIKICSEDLIDLIKIGDFVNGEQVKYVDDCKGCNREFYYDEEGMGIGYWFNDIETILTHEQYEQNCYEVEE